MMKEVLLKILRTIPRSNFSTTFLIHSQARILVFCFKYKSIDKRSAIAKALQKNAVFLETKKLYDNQVPEWINEYVKEKKYTIGPKATVS